MTVFHTAAEGMADEVAGLICALAPKKWTEIRFSRVPVEDRDSRSFEERTGRPRHFDIDLDNPSYVRADYVGGGSQGITVDYSLRIAYGRSPGWQDVMLEDWHQVQELIYRTPSTSAGVSLRIIDGGPTFLKNPTDQWTVLACTLRVVYDVTVS
jgi:hypothetical protein